MCYVCVSAPTVHFLTPAMVAVSFCVMAAVSCEGCWATGLLQSTAALLSNLRELHLLSGQCATLYIAVLETVPISSGIVWPVLIALASITK